MQSVRARVVACRRALAPRLVSAIIAFAATALCVGLLAARTSPLHVVDLPGYALFGLFVLAVPIAAIVLAYHSHVREARQRSEVESLLAIMRDVHAAVGTEAAAGVSPARPPAGRRGRRRAHAAHPDGRVLRAQVDGRERARRAFTNDTTESERTLLAELTYTAIVDLPDRARSGARASPASACRPRSSSRCAARRASSGCSPSSATSTSGHATAACSRRSGRTRAARSRAARRRARWWRSPSSRSGSRTRRATIR